MPFPRLYYDVAAEQLVAEVGRDLEVDSDASPSLLLYRRYYPKGKVHVVCDTVTTRQYRHRHRHRHIRHTPRTPTVR